MIPALTHWMVIGHFTGFPDPLEAGTLHSIFDDACDDFAEKMGTYHCADARVYRVEADGDDLRLINVTAEARARIAQWHRQRRDELPEWLEDAA